MRIEISHVNATLTDPQEDTRWRYLTSAQAHADDLLDRVSALRHIKIFSFVCDPEFWHSFGYRTVGGIDWEVPRRLYDVYLNAPNLEEIRLSRKKFGACLPKPPLVGYLKPYLPILFESASLAHRPWENLRALRFRGIGIPFSDFKALLKLLKRRGSLRVLEFIRVYLFFPDYMGGNHGWTHYIFSAIPGPSTDPSQFATHRGSFTKTATRPSAMLLSIRPRAPMVHRGNSPPPSCMSWAGPTKIQSGLLGCCLGSPVRSLTRSKQRQVNRDSGCLLDLCQSVIAWGGGSLVGQRSCDYGRE